MAQNKIDSSTYGTVHKVAPSVRRRLIIYSDEAQKTDRRFMINGKSATFIFNAFPLAVTYFIVVCILFVKFLIFKLCKLGESKNIFVIAINKNID